jgi:hypothetical protein
MSWINLNGRGPDPEIPSLRGHVNAYTYLIISERLFIRLFFHHWLSRSRTYTHKRRVLNITV